MRVTSPFNTLRKATSYMSRIHKFKYKLPKEAKQDFWENECIDHPTNAHCKVY